MIFIYYSQWSKFDQNYFASSLYFIYRIEAWARFNIKSNKPIQLLDEKQPTLLYHIYLLQFDEPGSETSKSADKINESDKSEEKSPALSREVSVFSVDMTVDPPDKEHIIKLKLFQVKKLIEETTCEVLTKPFQIAAFMKDKSVELKSFSEDTKHESSYILNRLSDAYSLLEKMLFKSENKRLEPTGAEEVPYKIETDPELKKRINHLIKCYRSNPDNMRVLTNV